MAISKRLSDFLKEINSSLHSILGRLDTLVGITSRPRQKTYENIGQENEAQQSDYDAIGKALLALKVTPSPEPSQNNANRWYKTLDGWKKLAELIAIPFAIGYAIITFYQWRDLRHNFEVDQRSWVKTEIGFPEKLTADSQVVITYQNIGKSPTTEIFGSLFVEVVDADKSPYFPTGENVREVEARIAFPSESATIFSGRTPNNPDGSVRVLTESEINRLVSGNAYLSAFGIFTYKDQFGEHWTRFCAYKGYQPFIRDYSVQRCERWNAVGEGKIKWSSPSED